MRVRVLLETMYGEWEVTLEAPETFASPRNNATARETLDKAVQAVKRAAGL